MTKKSNDCICTGTYADVRPWSPRCPIHGRVAIQRSDTQKGRLKWHSWVLDGNRLSDLRDSSGRIVARIKPTNGGAWELWDWRHGSLRESRVDTYLSLNQAKREGAVLMELRV